MIIAFGLDNPRGLDGINFSLLDGCPFIDLDDDKLTFRMRQLWEYWQELVNLLADQNETYQG